MIAETLKTYIKGALAEAGIEAGDIHLEHPADSSHGDIATNAALIYSKASGMNPHDVAERVAAYIRGQNNADIDAVEVAGPGFVNIRFSSEYFTRAVENARADSYGKHDAYAGKKVMVEYTDPNPFKEFHIGHLMSNAVGESLARVIEFSGAEVKRANFQGDVGLHVACAIWGIRKHGYDPADPAALGKAYAAGATAYKEDEDAKKEIDALNKTIYEGTDEEINALYKEGRAASLAVFEEMYARLGTKFDYYFFESETGALGEQIVRDNIGTVFEESDGAVIFPGEKYGLHTRVFINSAGLPTYEAKDLGLAEMKRRTWPSDISVSVTGNEVVDYFKVVRKAIERVFPDIAQAMRHVPHGMLRLPSGKMSSRTGDVVTAENLLTQVHEKLRPKLAETHVENPEDIADDIAVGAVKYAVLRQTAGKDIIFDFDKTISFDGDSGPYLQYTHARARSVLEKAEDLGAAPNADLLSGAEIAVARLLARFPEVTRRAAEEFEPHYITTYLTKLAGAFNSFYAHERIADAGDAASARVALTEAVAAILKNGLWLLGIEAPERM